MLLILQGCDVYLNLGTLMLGVLNHTSRNNSPFLADIVHYITLNFSVLPKPMSIYLTRISLYSLLLLISYFFTVPTPKTLKDTGLRVLDFNTFNRVKVTYKSYIYI